MSKTDMEEQKEKKPTLNDWKIIFKYLLVHRKDIIVISVLGIISALSTALVPMLVGKFLDSIVTPTVTYLPGLAIPSWVTFLSLWLLVQITSNTADWANDLKRRKLGTYFHRWYFARAMLRNPSILILDEPTSALRACINACTICTSA